MKKISITAALFFIALASGAQKSIPGFGKIDKAELEMKDCDFDKDAEAVKLIDQGSTYYDRGTVGISLFKTIFERRVRIKILKEKGLSQADVKISYYSHNDDEKIIKLNANSYNIDADGTIQTTEVKKSSIYSKRIDVNFSEMIIAFPNVKVGTVIEYRYTMERETMGQLRDWFFQGRIPVKYSEYKLKVPQIFRFSVQPSVIDPVEDKQEVVKELISAAEGVVETQSLKSTYIMRNLPGIKNEPFMGSPKDYMQRLEFQLSQIDFGNGNVEDLRLKWGDVIKDLMKHDDFGKQLEKTVSGTNTIIEEAKKINAEEERLKFIFNTVRKNINWNEEDEFYTRNGISKTWEVKKGNTADINLLLIKLLNDAGLKTFPILFSTRDNGLVTPHYPFLNQFNTVMACINLNDKYFILDATDKISNYKLVPEKIANTKGFIVEGDNGKWRDIVSGKYKYKVMAAVHGDIDNTGLMKGDCLVNCNDYARKQRVEKWIENKEKFREEYFGSSFNSALRIEDLKVNNVDADSLPLEQKVKFNLLLNNSGGYSYFNTNLFTDINKNPFIAEERITDIDFGFQQDYTIFGNYTIPQEYVFDGLPENISMIMPDTSIIFTRVVQADDNLLNIKITVEFKRSFYPAADYPEFKEFYKKMFAKLNEQVVIKKKI
jgi:hypothetical protein